MGVVAWDYQIARIADRAASADPVGDRTVDRDFGVPIHPSGGRVLFAEPHLGCSVDRAARGLAMRFHDRPGRRFLLRELNGHAKARADEADADLGNGLVVRFVDDLDRLDPGSARSNPLGIQEERVDRFPWSADERRALELPASSVASLSRRG